MDRGMDCFEEVLLKHIHKLENCLPYGDIIGKCLSTGIVTKYEYHDLEATQNKIKRNRETVLRITARPPDKIEEFCYLLEGIPGSKDLGTQLIKDCQLQKHNLIKHLKKELAEAKKGEGSNANTATVNSDVTFERNDANNDHLAELEEACARLKRQLKEKQLEAQKWKDAYSQVEKQLKELQASRSPSIRSSKRLFKADSNDDNLLIGTGKYGIVHRVKYHDKWHAGKTIHKSLYVDGSTNQTRVTVTCNKFFTLDHFNIEPFVAVDLSSLENIPMLLTEFFPENLNEFVSRHKINLPFGEQLTLVTNMADGLSYLHQNDIVHTNLHGRNVLINYQHQAKIGDFICSQLHKAGIIHIVTESSDTQAFVAPELLEDKAVHSKESDIFALGMLFLQVFVQEIPTVDNRLINKLDGCHPIQPLVYSCIGEEKEHRPDCAEVCEQLARSKSSSHCIMYNCLYGKKELPSMTSSLQSGHGQMKWIRLSNLPQPMHSAYAVRLDNNLYVTGGYGLERDVELCVFEFNLFLGTWRRLPDPEHKFGIPHVVCGKLVLFGGFDVATNKVTNKVSTYDKENNLWNALYPDLKECRSFPAVVSHANHVIVAGGKNREEILNDFEVMHTLECQWRKLKQCCLPKKMFNFSATISNHWLYLVRTIGSYPPSSSKQAFAIAMEAVMPSQDQESVKVESSWTRLSDVPHMNVTIVPDSFPPLLVGGSDNQGNTVNDVLLYDATAKSWKKVDALSRSRANVAVATVSSRAIIVLGGCTDSRTKDTCKSSAVDIVELGYMDESPM